MASFRATEQAVMSACMRERERQRKKESEREREREREELNQGRTENL